ncbi:MAG: 3-hydroxyacyl-CoA dehydrogenase family protein [Spirochaetes bacterium]|nr:3-hydroxyacyl-CoA dehydrogenase family protein [Spirochaetota bacterium]
MKIGVVGKGKMGSDIFYYLDDFDFDLRWVCRKREDVVKLNGAYEKKQARLKRNGVISDEEFLKKTTDTTISENLEILGDCDIIIEAVSENISVKRELFNKIYKISKKNAVILTNSSSIKPSSILSENIDAGTFLGAHFFYPVKLKNIVEIIYTEKTDKIIIDRVIDFMEKINRKYLLLDEKNAFILNQILLPAQAEAFNLSVEYSIPYSVIDAVVKSAFFPLGIFQFFDSVGNIVIVQSIKNYIFDEKDPVILRFYSQILNKMHEMILESEKISKSALFYDYLGIKDDKHSDKLIENYGDFLYKRIIYLFINSFFRYSEQSGVSPEKLDGAIKEYCGTDESAIDLSDAIGRKNIREYLNEIFYENKNKLFCPSKYLFN